MSVAHVLVYVRIFYLPIGPNYGPKPLVYTHVNYNLGPISQFSIPQKYVCKSYVRLRKIECHPSYFSRYVHDNFGTFGPKYGPNFERL